MRIRTIKPEFWASESVGRLDRETRLVFVGLWSLADDAGRFRADPRFIAGQLFPYDPDGVKVVSRGLASLREESTIVLYEVERCHYGAIPSWTSHQKIDKPSKSRLPEPPSPTPCEPSRALAEESPSIREPSWEEGKGKEGNGTGKGREWTNGAAAPSEPDDVDRLRDAWNANRAPTMPAWGITTHKRRKHAMARLADYGLEPMVEAVKRLAKSDFASGRTGQWAATAAWLVEQADSVAKTLEGNYDNRGAANTRSPVAAESVDWSNAQEGEIAL